jgi:type IV conjugative transfer system coupling protein TraD
MPKRNSVISMIRGGQITIHYIRMAKQVIKSYFYTTCFVFAFIFCALFVYQTDYRDRGYAFDYLSSYVFLKHTGKDYSLPVFVNGSYQKTKMSHILSNGFINAKYKNVKSSFKSSFLYSCLGFLITAVFVVFYIKRKGQDQLEKKLIRGNQIVESEDLILLLKRFVRSSKDKFVDYGLISLGGVEIPNTFEVTNVLVVGDQGVKKSQLLIENLKRFRESKKKAIIYDPSGDMIRKFYRADKDFILNPLDERSVSWDIWNECKKEYQLYSIANALIEGDPKRTDFFVLAARIVFISLVKKCKTLDELVFSVKVLSLESLAEYLKGSDAGVIIDENGARAAHSVRAVLLSHINSIFQTSKMKGDLFSISDWVVDHDDDSFLFISCPPNQLRMLKPLISIWIDITLFSILSLEPNRKRRIGTFIDELASLNRLESLSDFLAQARKYGNISFLGFQNISQIIGRYGNHAAKEITGLCGNWVVFRTSEYSNAKWISENLYSEDVLEKNENTSFGSNSVRDGVSINQNRHIRTLVTPTEIQSQEDGHAYLRIGRGFPIAKIEQEYQDLKDISRGFIEIEEGDFYYNDDSIVISDSESKKEKSSNGSSSINYTDIDLDI